MAPTHIMLTHFNYEYRRLKPLPRNILNSGKMIETSGENKKVITQTVEIPGHCRMHIAPGISEVKHPTFRTAAHGPSHMSMARRNRPSRKYKSPLWGHRGIQTVYSPFKFLDILVTHFRAPCPFRSRLVRSG